MTQNAIHSAAEDIKTLALYNPLLAFMLTRGQPLSPRIYNITLQWDSPAANQTLRDVGLPENMYQMFWVKYMLYSVRRPLFNVGVFGQRQQDEFTKLNPYIDVMFRTKGRTKNEFTDNMTPIEHLASPNTTTNPRTLDWVLTQDSNVSISAVNTRAFAQEEVPYIVTLSLVGLEMSGCELPSCAYDEVVCQLRKEGVYPQPILGNK